MSHEYPISRSGCPCRNDPLALAEGRGKVRNLGQFPNRPEAVRKLLEKLGGREDLKVCYEAGPTGYALYWQLTKLGVWCEVVAPSLIPRKAGERIKTDRRDAEKLAECYQSGTLTPVWVPDAAHEALRDLVRARAAAKKDESRAKHRLVKYLLRYGLRHPEGSRAWTHPWWRWVQALEFAHEPQKVTLGDCVAEVLHMAERVSRLDLAIDRCVETAPPEKKAVIEALQALRGVAKLTAVTIMTEVGTFQRFQKPTELMGYTGLVPSEYSSGGREAKGRITRNWQCAPPPRPRRDRLARPAPALVEHTPEEDPADPASRRFRDRLEGPGAAAQKVHQAHLPSQASRQGRDGGRARARRIRLGDRILGGKGGAREGRLGTANDEIDRSAVRSGRLGIDRIARK